MELSGLHIINYPKGGVLKVT